MSLITLTDGLTSVNLPGGLDWPDRLAWSPVAQSVSRGLTGALIVQTATMTAGRPITLQGHEQRALVPRSVCDALQAWAEQPGLPLTVTLAGTAYPVYMRHHEPPAFTARPLFELANPPADWLHYITLKLMTRTA